MNKDAVKREINDKVKLIDNALNEFLPGIEENPSLIHKAMRYSIFAGGKRLRPVLFLASAEAVGGCLEQLLPTACALELIHTYSLVHDDLPAMDNDDYRRGRLTSHKIYGEAIAILAGDALLTLAFELIGNNESVNPEVRIKVIREIAIAAGSRGMIGGQVVDIQSENKEIDCEILKYIHSHKTGALFSAAVRSGALMGGANMDQLTCLAEYANQMGLAFQITDDILDVEGDSEKLGKTVGSDERKKKCTYPALFGLDKSKQLATESVRSALEALAGFGNEADVLRYIAAFLLQRDR